MAKLTLNPIGSFTQAAVTTINANMDAIEVALENTLSRDGTTPNQMTADLDMNNNDVLNADTVNTRSIILDGEVLIPTDINSGSAQAILDAIKTVDGTGSGLDADLLDGLHSTSFVKYADTSTSTMQFVIDEDNMASNSDTKVPTQQSVKAYVDAASDLQEVATRVALKALDTSRDTLAYLTETGREGIFVWKTGNFSSQVTDDTAEGVYVKADAVASSAGAWVREFSGPHDLRWYGAVSGAGSAAANTAALSAALRSNREVHIPVGGTFEFNGPLTISGLSSFKFRGTGFGTVLKLMTNTQGLIFNGCQRFKISDFGWTTDTAVVLANTSDCLVINGTSGVGTISDNQFFSISGNGLRCFFTSGAPASAMLIAHNLFLSCGVAGGATSGAAAFHAEYMNDSRVYDNEFGNLGLVGPRASAGSLLINCKAGNYEGNYHWENVVGCQMVACDYSRILGNRFETNQQQGLEMTNTREFVFDGNTLHTNSMQTSATYDHARFFNCDRGTLSNNITFEWTGGVTLVNFAFAFDTNCSEMNVSGNSLYGFSTSPVSNASTNDMRFTNNFPIQLNLAQAYGTWLTGNGAITAGATIFLGPAGSSATEALVATQTPNKCSTVFLSVACDTAPGAAQSYTFTVRKNGVDTAMVATITGAASFAATNGTRITYAQGDFIDVKAVATAGTAASNLRATISISG